MVHSKKLRGVLGMVFALSSTTALAQDETKELDDKALQKTALGDKKKKKDGFKLKANVGFSGALNHTSAVVGVEDGVTLQLGLSVGLNAHLISGQHDWENIFSLQHAQTKTPQLSGFVKSLDLLDFTSTYLFRLESIDWLGPFARFKFQSNVLNGDAVFVDPNGREVRQRLTGPFEPMLLRETVGAFAKPSDKKDLKVDVKLGVGAQHIVAFKGVRITGDDPVLQASGDYLFETEKLLDSTDIGAELELTSTGTLIDPVLSYKFGGNMFFAFYSTSEKDLSGVDLLNFEVYAGISLKIAKWLSVDYNFNVRRVPAVQTEVQIQNQLLLNVGFNII